MFGLKLIYIHGNNSWGAWVTRPITALIRPQSVAMMQFVVLLVSFVRRELESVRKFAISLIMRHLRVLKMATLVALICFAGCDQTKPEATADRFSGFASEQLSEQIENVSVKLDQSIEDNGQAQSEILAAVRDLSQTVAGMQLATTQQLESLKKVSGRAKTKLTSAGDEKEGVGTLDVNTAPSARLELDSLDDAADQIQALFKRIDELEKRCQCGRTPVSIAAPAAPAASNYPTVSNASGGNSSGAPKSSFAGNSSGSNYQGYTQPVYSQPVYFQPVYSTPVSQTSYSGQCYVDPMTGNTVCPQNYSQPQTYRTGLFGRKILN